MAELKFTGENFKEEVLSSCVPVLVDFYATWCGPCRMLAPIVEEIAEETDVRAKVGKVDVDENPELCDAYGISVVPTVIIFKDGKPVHTLTGYRQKEELTKLLF